MSDDNQTPQGTDHPVDRDEQIAKAREDLSAMMQDEKMQHYMRLCLHRIRQLEIDYDDLAEMLAGIFLANAGNHHEFAFEQLNASLVMIYQLKQVKRASRGLTPEQLHDLSLAGFDQLGEYLKKIEDGYKGDAPPTQPEDATDAKTE